jgi:hypothetical protein
MDDVYKILLKARKWGVYEHARRSYRLDGYLDEREREESTRKMVFYQGIRYTEVPMAR